MDLGLKGKIVLITGASRGIGRAMASAFAAEGCDLMLSGRTSESLDRARTTLAGESGRRVGAVTADLSKPGSEDTVIRAVKAAYGRLDILVNNAGAVRAGDFLELTDADWQGSYALKLFGYIRMCRAAWPLLCKSQGVVINNIGAAAKQPLPDFMIGASINAALHNFTKALANRGIDDGVRVNAIHSGPVRVERLEMMLERLAAEQGRSKDEIAAERARSLGMTQYAMAEDLATLALFLASDRARHIHGSGIFIDGGQTKEV